MTGNEKYYLKSAILGVALTVLFCLLLVPYLPLVLPHPRRLELPLPTWHVIYTYSISWVFTLSLVLTSHITVPF